MKLEKPSRNPKVPSKRNEVQRTPASTLVLPSLPKTMQRRKRIQMPHAVRTAFTTVVVDWGECGTTY